MVDIILTEDERTQCSMQTLDLVTKAFLAGAGAYVLWNVVVKEQIVGSDLPARVARSAAHRLAQRFGYGGE
jgi:hypothetical protein